ncbi:hypothetical protein FQN57_006272 [Myotisia sp. PD_48]|nr:hypothetical protein FQN57_006272 [Myotisia sp. PD_48]
MPSREFSASEFQSALEILDAQLGTSRHVSPIKLVCAGGYVAVSYLRNRLSTRDIDYFIDPEIDNRFGVYSKFYQAVSVAAESHVLTTDWINSRMEVFTMPQAYQRVLFRKSIEQNVILWQGRNFVIYAIQWEWSLAQKLRRIAVKPRQNDVSDAVALLKVMVDNNGGPIHGSTIKAIGSDNILSVPIQDPELVQVATAFKKKFGINGVQ